MIRKGHRIRRTWNQSNPNRACSSTRKLRPNPTTLNQPLAWGRRELSQSWALAAVSRIIWLRSEVELLRLLYCHTKMWIGWVVSVKISCRSSIGRMYSSRIQSKVIRKIVLCANKSSTSKLMTSKHRSHNLKRETQHQRPVTIKSLMITLTTSMQLVSSSINSVTRSLWQRSRKRLSSNK